MTTASQFRVPIFANETRKLDAPSSPLKAEVSVSASTSSTPNPLLLGRIEEKPKAVLCHELGAGSPCFKCGDRCEGLDLHYWRKICKNCFCRLDEHDIILSQELDHGEFIIRKLFDFRPKSIFEGVNDNDKQCATDAIVNNDGRDYGGIVAKLRQIHISAQNSAVANASRRAPLSPNSANNDASVNSLNGGHFAPTIPSSSVRTATLEPSNIGAAHFAKKANGKNDALSAATTTADYQYAWLPAGERTIVERYMQSLPVDERPIQGTVGAQLRRQRLAYQLPYHDCDMDAAKSLHNEEEQKKHSTFVNFVKKNVVGIGEVSDMSQHYTKFAVIGENSNILTRKNAEKCRTCGKNLARNDVGIVTEHGENDEIWHPDCFRCAICHQLLADLFYFFKDGQYFCGRHYGESVYPRCGGCDELIFAREYTFAEERAWHVDHFCCFGCDLHLGGHSYVTKEDNTYCIDCYMRKFARTCTACRSKISPLESRISHKDFHWHAKEHCFKCAVCSKPLTNQKFSLRDEKIFCSATCIRSYPTKR